MKAKSVGNSGEDLAAHYLQSKGYKILENNFYVRGGELDLIAEKNGVLVFVEVKTRTGDLFGAGEESMNKKKMRSIKKSIDFYLAKTGRVDCDYRFDLIDIQLCPDRKSAVKINHFEDLEL